MRPRALPNWPPVRKRFAESWRCQFEQLGDELETGGVERGLGRASPSWSRDTPDAPCCVNSHARARSAGEPSNLVSRDLSRGLVSEPCWQIGNGPDSADRRRLGGRRPTDVVA